MKLLTVTFSLLLFVISAVGQQPSPRPSETPRPATAPQPEEPPTVKKQTVRVRGQQLSYTTTTGFMPIKNTLNGETEGRMFYVAYTLDNAPAGRPLMFSFNGGPGSASVWLHLGALGPRRIRMQDDGGLPAPPYQLVDNENTWL